ncbi:hypothetical protein L218DRAFT_951722 [Marasmius fiardii PR-910]|nr:hypothetical protein L218DRAFT_951722 [Marasmius fiardii PR-910]
MTNGKKYLDKNISFRSQGIEGVQSIYQPDDASVGSTECLKWYLSSWNIRSATLKFGGKLAESGSRQQVKDYHDARQHGGMDESRRPNGPYLLAAQGVRRAPELLLACQISGAMKKEMCMEVTWGRGEKGKSQNAVLALRDRTARTSIKKNGTLE